MGTADLYCDPRQIRRQRQRPLIFGHRGMPGDRVENRIPAFLEALRLGADGIECDVQLSADGVPVIAHDRTLQRVAGMPGEVIRCTAGELQWAGLPSLADLLDAMPADALLNLEVKDNRPAGHGLEEAIVRVIGKRGGQCRVLFSSFNPCALARLRRLDQRYYTAQLLSPGLWPADMAARFGSNAGVHPHARQASPATVARWTARGTVLVWGDTGPSDLERLFGLGVDGVITDHVEAAVEIAGRYDNRQ